MRQITNALIRGNTLFFYNPSNRKHFLSIQSSHPEKSIAFQWCANKVSDKFEMQSGKEPYKV